jgi:hypothetical protein
MIKKTKGKEVGQDKGKVPFVPHITADLYNKMWAAYGVKQSARHVAKTTGCALQTALFYVKGVAAPADGFEPIRERWLRVQAAVQEEQELNIITLRRGEIDWARKQLAALHGEMELAVADVRQRVERYHAKGGTEAPQRELDLAEVVNAYEKAVRTAEHLLGGPDAVIEGRGGSFDPLDALDDEEALAYVTKGVLPESVRQHATVNIPLPGKAKK